MSDRSAVPIIRKVFPGYILTYIASALGSCISSLVDSLVVSNMMGTDALAAMGIVTPYYTVLSLFGAFFYAGVQIQCSRALGTGDKEKSDTWFSLTLESALLFAAAASVLLCVFSRSIAVILGVSPDNTALLENVMAFNRGFFLNIPLTLLNSILVMAAGTDGRKRIISLSVAVTILVDTAGNLLAVTVFHTGIFGIALATSLASLCADIVLALHILRGKSAFRFKAVPIRLSMLPEIWKYGLPKTTYKLLVILRTVLLDRLLLRTGGTPAMASMAVIGSLSHILLAPAVGVSNTAFLMSSVFFGEEDSRSLRQVARCVLVYSLVFVSLFALLVFLCASPIVRLFLSQVGQQHDITVRALRLYLIFLPLTALSEGLFGYIQGSGKRRLAQVFAASVQVCLAAAMYALAPLLGTDGLWLSFSLGAAVGMAAFFGGILYTQRLEKVPLSDKLLLIPASAREADENSVDVDVKYMADAAAVSERIYGFCRKKGVDDRRAYYAALCAEEMAKNVIQHGFRPGKENNCSVRLVIRGEDVVLRIRDNCEEFNTKEYFRHHEKAEDAASGIGIRLVCSLAREVQYVRLLKINTLSIMI